MFWQSMIQEILNKGSYKFSGTVDDLRKCINSFKITTVVCEGCVQGIDLYEAYGKFKYHGHYHKVHISKHWGGEQILFIKYLGGHDGN